MADVGTPSAMDISYASATPEVEKQHKARPEKPDEEKYKADLANAEKEHTAAQERLVSLLYGTRPVRMTSHLGYILGHTSLILLHSVLIVLFI